MSEKKNTMISRPIMIVAVCALAFMYFMSHWSHIPQEHSHDGHDAHGTEHIEDAHHGAAPAKTEEAHDHDAHEGHDHNQEEAGHLFREKYLEERLPERWPFLCLPLRAIQDMQGNLRRHAYTPWKDEEAHSTVYIEMLFPLGI